LKATISILDGNNNLGANVLPGTTEFGVPIRWKEIIKCKEEFLRFNKDPRLSPYMDPRVAESWIKSRDNGIDPYMKEIGKNLSTQDLNSRMEQNKLLIDTALPLIGAFKPLLNISGFRLSLRDKDGILLDIIVPEEINSSIKGIDAKVGCIWTEDTAGTNAHSLSIAYKCPIQLLGPENYCYALTNNISSAAPILDEKGEVIATLVLVQGLENFHLEQNFENMQSHTLGWITSMCVAVTAQLEVRQQNIRLSTINSILDTTISFISEGVFTVDNMNRITHMNKKCARMLNIGEHQVEGQTILEILGEQPFIFETLSKNKTKQEVEVVIRNKPFWACITPVLSDIHAKINGAVIQLQDIDKVNSLVNRRSGASAKYTFESIMGDSPSMIKTKEQARKFAHADDNILLIGESGTGKELFAQAIHNEYRSQGPFIAINCAAVPRNLIESELFGYVGGAFTGANREGRPGKIEMAHGGTLFLDEIGDMPFEIQSVLLRVLDDKRVMRVGGKEYNNVNFRVIAATHKNLYTMIEQNQFRHDLYYRLCVLKVNIPPLRNRGTDILTISEKLISNYCQRMGWDKIKISNEVKRRMVEYDWPGNVRQLESAIIHAVNVAYDVDDVIQFEHLPEEITSHNNFMPAQAAEGDILPIATMNQIMSSEEPEKIAIQNALRRTGKNIDLMAKILNMGKSTLYRKLKKYGL